MEQIQGLAAHAAGAELLPFKYDPGELGLQEVEIAITHCGVCHSDLHLIANDWESASIRSFPATRLWARSRRWDPRCSCSRWASAWAWAGNRTPAECANGALGGWKTFCPASEEPCVHRHGGYADRVRANARFVIPIPEALESEQTAPLLCGRHYGV